MTKTTLFLLSLFLSSAKAWTTTRQRILSVSHLRMADTRDNPCWQDIYDDDCSMSNVYAASFVASKWIKSLPCAAGIEDCDMPQDLNLPGIHQDSGVDQVDVMAFLNLKRAESVDKKSSSGSEESSAST